MSSLAQSFLKYILKNACEWDRISNNKHMKMVLNERFCHMVWLKYLLLLAFLLLLESLPLLASLLVSFIAIASLLFVNVLLFLMSSLLWQPCCCWRPCYCWCHYCSWHLRCCFGCPCKVSTSLFLQISMSDFSKLSFCVANFSALGRFWISCNCPLYCPRTVQYIQHYKENWVHLRQCKLISCS